MREGDLPIRRRGMVPSRLQAAPPRQVKPGNGLGDQRAGRPDAARIQKMEYLMFRRTAFALAAVAAIGAAALAPVSASAQFRPSPHIVGPGTHGGFSPGHLNTGKFVGGPTSLCLHREVIRREGFGGWHTIVRWVNICR
jgi:hypothetical protein